MDRRKFRVFVLLPSKGPLVEEIHKVSDVTVDIFNVAVLRRKNLSFIGAVKYMKGFLQSYFFIKKYIKKNCIDIVDTNTAVVFPGAIAAKHLGKKNVWHIREIIKSQFENKVISMIMQRYANVIIANSKATGNALAVRQDKIRVVYNAVDEKNQVISDDNQKNKEVVVIGMAGRINRWKGQKLFVDAAMIVNKSFPNAIFMIAGSAYIGEKYMERELKEYIKSRKLEKTVRLLGQLNDMDEFYKSIDVFVLPSIQPEPFGLVVLEAMEFRVPVIATNHGGPTEIIEDGVNGYLINNNSPGQMAARIIELIEHPDKRKKVGVIGQIHKRQTFSIKKMVSKIEQIIGSV
jgi:glycosyltransferase involved in cell wall biosynthesis